MIAEAIANGLKLEKLIMSVPIVTTIPELFCKQQGIFAAIYSKHVPHWHRPHVLDTFR